MTRVTADYIATVLAESFGSESVRVCTPHHLQVRVHGHAHQVYVNSRGVITLHRAGQKQAKHVGHVQRLVEAIELHKPENTDIAKMREAVDIAKFVGYAKSALPSVYQCGVFVDAGWKDGVASIAIVEIRRGELGLSVVAQSWPEYSVGVHDAELRAIDEGLSFNTNAIVFSDRKGAVDSLNNPRVKWIPREANKVADKLGNRRGK